MRRLCSSVGIMISYGLEDRDSGFRFPAETGNSLPHRVQPGSSFHPASYSVGTGGKAAGT
jgi:hypothetical protein